MENKYGWDTALGMTNVVARKVYADLFRKDVELARRLLAKAEKTERAYCWLIGNGVKAREAMRIVIEHGAYILERQISLPETEFLDFEIQEYKAIWA